MKLDWVALEGFRSYTELEWHPDPGVNVLVGPNGAGKTNLLEAVGYLANLRSFRGVSDDGLIHHDADSGVVRGQVESGDASSLIEVELRRNGPRRALVNRSRLGRTADLLGYIRVVTFLPDDLDIVKRGPGYRRAFLDAVAIQLWPGSYLDQAEFQRALRQRNVFLKQRSNDMVTLSVWDERLAQAGAKVMARRARAASVLLPHLVSAHTEIADDQSEIGVRYESDWGGDLNPGITVSEFAARLAQVLGERRSRDLERRVTTSGPQRDEPIFTHDGYDLRYHGSQGEQRTIALSLRLASHRAVEASTGAPPLLLLDDVYSELDPQRAEALTHALPLSQTLVTTADPAQVPLEGASWQVREGTVK